MLTAQIHVKKILFFILAGFIAAAPVYTQTDLKREAVKRALQYQIDISSKTAAYIQDIYLTFQDSFVDYKPALDRINVLINEYNKAMELIPLEPDGETLNYLMKQLLSRTEKYFVYYKKSGREYPYVNFQILETMIAISRETRRLEYQYGIQ